jgi:hypothetical protein
MSDLSLTLRRWLHSDGNKLTRSCRRPHYREAEDIGAWQHVIALISTVAVITNALLVTFVGTAAASMLPTNSPEGASDAAPDAGECDTYLRG